MSFNHEKIKNENIDKKQIIKPNMLSYNIKNDTFYLFIKAFHSIDNFFIFIYSHFSLYLKTKVNVKIFNIKKIFFTFFLFFFLFSIVLNENINISTDLLINAYFNDSQITHISYERVIKGKFDENNHNSNNKYSYNNKNNNCQGCYNLCENKNNQECTNNNSNKQKNNYNDKYEQEKDYYMFNIFPLKRIFFTCFSFFSLYIIIKTTYYSRINNSIFINIVGVYTSFKILSYLYFTKYYSASGFVFVLFFYFFKCSIDSIYFILKFKRSDFEIFSIHLTAVNSRQFILKFIILFTGTILSGILSILFFQFYFNYTAFYICLFTFIIFMCNCVENELLKNHKYSKNVLIFIFGLINFTINKLIQNKYYLLNEYECNQETKKDSDESSYLHFIDYLMVPNNYSNANTFYIISDIFTLLCFDYIDEYIEYKYKNFLDKKKKIKKIYSRHDIIFHFLFIVSIGLSITGIIIKEYMCFLLSFNISQKFNHYFSIIFNNNLSRILNHIILLLYIITQYEISTSEDEYLVNLLLNIRLRKDIIIILLKIFGISVLLYDLIYSNFIYYYSNNSYKTYYHYYNEFDPIKNIPENDHNNENNNNTNNNNNNNNDSFSDDGENIIDDDNYGFNNCLKDNFFEFASQINTKKYKIKIIHNNNDENSSIIFYLTNEIVLCYIDTCLIIIFVIAYEKNIIVNLIYGLIIVFLNSRKYFIFNEIKNNGQYYFYYLVSFFFAIRLIILTNNNSMSLNYLAHINVYILLVYYCLFNKRNYFLSIILLLHLTVAHANLKSYFILFDIVSVLIFLLIKNFKNKKKYKIDKYEEPNNNLSLIFLLSLLGIFLLQLYGINKIYSLFQDTIDKITNFFNDLNFISYGGNKDRKGQPIEYYLITDLINWIEKK